MISFSGIDCGGKSTQIDKVYEKLTEQHIKCKIIHSRIGYTPVLEFFKTLIRRDKGLLDSEKADYREAIHTNSKKRRLLLWLSIMDISLYYGIYFRIIELFGTTILADRYFWDSYIDLKMKYFDIDYEKWIAWNICKIIYKKPKYSIIYVIPAEVSMYRSTLKDEPWPEPIEVREKRIKMYMEEIKSNRWKYIIDATKTIDEVFYETMEIINK
ncbi:MAG: hypothetical protein J6N52_07535 [Clostridia bacterium]|nr:hypothetical protein [Clostridia bacterium]